MTRYLITYNHENRCVFLHTDAAPADVGHLANILARRYEYVEMRCGNAYPDRLDRGALLWVDGRFTPRGDMELANYTGRGR